MSKRNLWSRKKTDGTNQIVIQIGQAECMKKNSSGEKDIIQVFQVVGEETHNRYLLLSDFKKFFTEVTTGYD